MTEKTILSPDGAEAETPIGVAHQLSGFRKLALPITASHLVLVVLAGPTFDQLGVPILAAHLIVFWFSQDSNITPPVCLGASSPPASQGPIRGRQDG